MTARRPIITFVALVLASASAPAMAVAQECSEGRLRIEGRCCWPGQSWSLEHGRCDGAPTCPTGLVEHGETCVAPAVSSTGYGGFGAGAVPSRASSTAAWPSSTEDENAPTAWATQGRGEDEGLIIAAFVVFDVGWLLGLLGGFLDELRAGGSSWVIAGAPLVGGMVSAFVNLTPSRDTWGFGVFSFSFGIPSIIFQGIGLIMMPIAFANETTEAVFSPIDVAPGVTASIAPSAPGADLGLSLHVGF